MFRWQRKIGERVKRDNKNGRIIARYCKTDSIGFYPELYVVKWDSGEIEKGFLWHGLQAI